MNTVQTLIKHLLALVLLIQLSAITVSAANLEFKSITPSQNSQFIVALYQKLLNRTPTTKEISPFLEAIKNGRSKVSIAQAVLSNTEFRTKLIQDLFSRYLDRTADSNSLTAFLALYQNGGGTFDVRKLILGSAEYFLHLMQVS